MHENFLEFSRGFLKLENLKIDLIGKDKNEIGTFFQTPFKNLLFLKSLERIDFEVQEGCSEFSKLY